jgi:hypothetical protein
LAGYTKLFSSILASTIWRADNETRIVWITMLAMSDKAGRVEASIPGLADLARVPLEACEHALNQLQQPDKYSRTEDYDGRRIEKIDGGWRLINHGKYRDKMSRDERREYLKIKQREYRARQHGVNTDGDKSTLLTHTAPAPDTDTEDLDLLISTDNQLDTDLSKKLAARNHSLPEINKRTRKRLPTVHLQGRSNGISRQRRGR